MKHEITGFEIVILLFVVMVGIALVSTGFGGCTDPQAATRVLEDEGYKDIDITGYRPWLKGEDDTISTGFEATAPNGRRVSGAVTSGWMKGNTVRLE